MKTKIISLLFLSFLIFPMISLGANPSGKSVQKLSNPNSSPEAKAVFKYIHDMYGKKTLSGQMWAPWGIDELKYIKEVTGKQPAIRGIDYIHERDNEAETNNAIEWWRAGGIPTIMWHWGAPGIGEGYENSKKQIDINRCFQEGTPEYKAFWAELKTKADHLEKLRDAKVPVLWRPMHELNGNWFWWGKQGPELFIKVWKTMYNYYTNERKLNNLIWVLCYTGDPDGAWNPGAEYFDIAGPDTYGGGPDPQLKMFNEVRDILGNTTTPIAYHECGTPPDPDKSFEVGATWSWWMEWHTSHLTKIDKEYLRKVYDHELVITLDEVPDIMAVYGSQKVKSKKLSFSNFTFTDIGASTKSGESNVKNDQLEMIAGGADIWGTKDEFRFGYKKLKGDFDVSVQILSLSKANQYTKAGIMARTDLTDDSQHVYFQIFPDNTPRNKNNGGCEFQYRTEKGGDMKAIYPNLETAGNKFDVDFPETYIRLKRVGDLFESYCSHDNKEWNLYSTFTLKMPKELFVGMAVTSHNSDEFTNAEFADFSIKK